MHTQAVHGLCEREGFIEKLLDYHSLEKELILAAIGIQVIFTAIFLTVFLLNEDDGD